MNIGLIDVDGHHFPNLALMRISAYHKARGDAVENRLAAAGGRMKHMGDIKITKSWAMSNSQTFSIPPIKAFVEKYIDGATVIVDPFANSCKYGTITNDMNTNFDTDYHLDALDFLKLQSSESADVVLYDPPYSPRQVSECYKGVGKEVTMETTQSSWRAKHLDEIARITKPNGIVLCFGWNSAGVGKRRGFEQVEILLVAHGGSKNDTICSAEVKRQAE